MIFSPLRQQLSFDTRADYTTHTLRQWGCQTLYILNEVQRKVSNTKVNVTDRPCIFGYRVKNW